MKTWKIVMITMTATFLLISVFAAFNMDRGVDKQPDPPTNDITDTIPTDKATLVITERVSGEAYFDDSNGNCVQLSSGEIDPGRYNVCSHDAHDTVLISTDELYSEISLIFVGNVRVTFEAGKTYYIWFETEDPRY